MKRLLNVLALSIAVSSPIPGTMAVAGEAEPAKAATYFRLLVGHPDPASAGPSVLVVPGMVSSLAAAAPGTDVFKVIDELKAAYRLGTIDIASSRLVTFSPAQTAEVAEVPGGPQISATMVDFDDKAATLKISLTENGKVLAEPTLRTIRGERAVVGTRNGPAAPYVFLLIEPLEAPAFDRAGARKSGAGDIVIPQAIKRVQPAYPEEARKAKLEGVVLLECTVGADGRVKGCRASRREPLGLTDAAIAAVSQWEFEPARDGAGQPIEVMMTITIRFALS